MDAISSWVTAERAARSVDKPRVVGAAAKDGGALTEGVIRRVVAEEMAKVPTGGSSSGSASASASSGAQASGGAAAAQEAPMEIFASVVGKALKDGLGQAFGKGGKPKGGGRGSGDGKPELRICERCKRLHCPDLPKANCPNVVTFHEGRLQKLIEDKVKCSFWVRRTDDGKKIECGGEGHTWEDHMQAKKEYEASQAEQQVTGAGRKGRGASKGRGRGRDRGAAAVESAGDDADGANYDALLQQLLSRWGRPHGARAQGLLRWSRVG